MSHEVDVMHIRNFHGSHPSMDVSLHPKNTTETKVLVKISTVDSLLFSKIVGCNTIVVVFIASKASCKASLL
uniref:Putative ovule protein n=1 Tax=Solanum chacoense TaxID=4108 RepID=A0A0V0GP11_SOLCH